MSLSEFISSEELLLSDDITITTKIIIIINTTDNNIFDVKYASGVVINARGFGGRDPRYYYPGLPRNYFISLSFSL